MTAVVTGAAGFVGSHLCRALLDAGHEVIGVDCFTDYYARSAKEAHLTGLRGRPHFWLVEADLLTMRLEPVLDGAEYVFHLAGQPGVRASWGADFETYARQNVLVTQRLLEACRGLSVGKLVYASSSSVYGDDTPLPMHEQALPRPLSPYGVTKLAAEQLCHLYAANHGVPATAVRYFTVYGPRQRPDMGFHRFLKAAISGSPITVYGDGEQTRDFTFVGDAVAATILAGARGVPGRAYNIGGGSRVSINHVLDLIAEISGRPIDIRREPSQKGDMRDTYADTSLARADLGFSPTTSLKDGLTAEYHWLLTSPVLA